MLKARIAIVGGGLSGLYAALLLEERGVRDYVVLEARETFGGRILSVAQAADAVSAARQGNSGDGRYDLGATWFWPTLQPDLLRLVGELGLQTFAQYESGDMLVERSRSHAPDRFEGYASAPAALRMAGGMAALTDAIRSRLRADRLVPACRVQSLSQRGNYVDVQAQDGQGAGVSWQVEHVLLAVPPRLAASTIAFAPALPDAAMTQWKSAGTWMAPHAKYLAVFDEPFWRERGLPGEARSHVGPMVELHDASGPGGEAALFGFLGVPAQVRATVPEAVLLAHCRAQLRRLFGEQAAMPRKDFLKDWARDPYTAVDDDQAPDPHSFFALSATVACGPWSDRLTGVASEWSPDFSGYVAGAVDAAGRGVEALLERQATSAGEQAG